MSNRLKNILAFGLLLFLGLHFLLLLNYTAPLKTGGKLTSASIRYCYPFFHQQWTVFVPAPTNQFDLYIRNGNGSSWQPWVKVTQRFIKKQRQHPFEGRETEVLLLSSAINYVAYDLGEGSRIFNEPPDLPSFKIMERAAHFFFRNYRCWAEGKQYELVLVTKAPKKTYVYYFKNLSLL
jgi:hypothetical protein